MKRGVAWGKRKAETRTQPTHKHYINMTHRIQTEAVTSRHARPDQVFDIFLGGRWEFVTETGIADRDSIRGYRGALKASRYLFEISAKSRNLFEVKAGLPGK